MRVRSLQFLAIVLCIASASASCAADQAADEATIRANAEKYVQAYNRRDSKSMAAMWSPEAVYQDPSSGESVAGRDAIAKHLADVFAGADDAKLAVSIESIDFLSPNVALEKGIADVTYSESDPEKTEYSAVHVKRDGEWLLDRVSEVERPTPPPSQYEQLKELEWMVGTWIDEDETSTIQTDCEWAKNKNFLTRSFAVMVGGRVEMSGMQIIGWDPAAKQIRSWYSTRTALSPKADGRGKTTAGPLHKLARCPTARNRPPRTSSPDSTTTRARGNRSIAKPMAKCSRTLQKCCSCAGRPRPTFRLTSTWKPMNRQQRNRSNPPTQPRQANRCESLGAISHVQAIAV